MIARVILDAQSVPRLAPHIRLRFDKVRDCWTIQAPERSFVLDVPAHAIVSRCDGNTNIDAIVDDLCVAFVGAPREIVGKDVLVLLQDFVDKGVMKA
jgi:pyrroloquinoline quinone biosynthesis protein D